VRGVGAGWRGGGAPPPPQTFYEKQLHPKTQKDYKESNCGSLKYLTNILGSYWRPSYNGDTERCMAYV